MEVIQALICIWEMGMLFYAAFQLLPQRRMHVITKIIWWMCVALDTGLLIYQRLTYMYSRYYLLFSIAITFIFIIWRFYITKVDCIWGIAVYFETTYIIDLILVVIVASIYDFQQKIIENIMCQISIGRVAIFIVSQLIILLLLVLIEKNRLALMEIYRNGKKILLFLPILEYIMLLQCDIVFTANKQEKGAQNCLLFAGVYLCLSILFMLYYGYQQKKYQVELLREKNKVIEQEYKNIIEWSKKRSGLLHDMQNHLLVLSGMLENEENKRALAYIEKLMTMQKRKTQIAYTGNAVLDSLLNEKICCANEKGIKIKIEIDECEEMFVSDEDLCIIVSNVLDNAIEAAQQVEGEKQIGLQISGMPWGLRILVVNDCKVEEDNFEDKENKIVTTKKNAKEHGIGLQNVQTAISKYRGNMKCERLERSFHVNIMLYR